MRPNYFDIVEAANIAPIWFDEYGVPRFCKFEPLKLANSSVDECCLLEIECQNCGEVFQVALSCKIKSCAGYHIARRIKMRLEGNNILHYGDPPNIGCCGIGHTMSSVTRRVVEYWYLENNKINWTRDSSLEVFFDA